MIEELEAGLQELQREAVEKEIHIVFGTCLYEQDERYNAGIYLSPKGDKHIYKKVNLAFHERKVMKAGNVLRTFELRVGGA
ncbi:nitrilase-related carbon-nitrogen hydrolase [Peribacillus deserti]|uniref:CN hydrolase domain-containing protein n=1 Tax=Peribacillus deserti TaxID=673318 RepID=A0A2N5M9K4_9BACI|nr:nitrilase-related carbon-nitrogen hydrolase [Peribacillus deserti]PLT31034.1 hypothetical protein CUU66_04305 [Peribacillus deserti]